MTETADRLPRFCNDPKEDKVTAEDWIDRLAAQAASAGWQPAKAVNEGRLALGKRALDWYNSLARKRPNCYSDFEAFVDAFREEYEITQKPEDLIAKFDELKQRQNEKPNEFYVRCENVVIKQQALVVLEPITDEPDPNTLRKMEEQRAKDMTKIMDILLIQWFVGGLKPELRSQVITKRPRTPELARAHAIDAQLSLDSKNETKAKEPPTFSVDNDDETDINAVGRNNYSYNNRGGRGRGRGNYYNNNQQGYNNPGRGNFRGNSRGRGNYNGSRTYQNNQNNTPFPPGTKVPRDVCIYCRIKGHWQRDCRKRIRDKKPMARIYFVDTDTIMVGETSYAEFDNADQSAPQIASNAPTTQNTQNPAPVTNNGLKTMCIDTVLPQVDYVGHELKPNYIQHARMNDSGNE